MVFLDNNIKSKNDITNKTREDIISRILDEKDFPPDYFIDPIFGQHWTNIRDKLRIALDSLYSESYHHISISKKGGRAHNYDFIINYCDINNVIVYSINLEFKHNNTSVKNIVQFLELYDKDCKTKFELFEYSYSEYYYDNYLDTYLMIDGDIVKPSKEVYLKHVYDIKFKHPFFNHIYTNKNQNQKTKDLLVKESIREFIKTYVHTFHFEKITEKIIDSQSDKVFLLWDKNNFIIQQIDVKNMCISGIKTDSVNSMYFDVVVDNFIYNIRIRLNWGNNNGIANPRWKLSFIDK